MKKLPNTVYVFWNGDGFDMETDYKKCISDDETKVVVGVYHLQYMQVVEKEITLSTKRVSKTGKIGRHP